MKQTFWQTVDSVVGNSDLVLYILDARHPEESRNKDAERLFKRKSRKCIYVFTKSDLVQGRPKIPADCKPHVVISSKSYYGLKKLKDAIFIECKRLKKRALKYSKPRLSIVGYPNVGKSSLSNALKGKHAAPTSPEPGHTKGQQFIATRNYLLIDTPGVIPRTEKNEVVKQVKLTVKSVHQKDAQEVAEKLVEMGEGKVEKFYGVKTDEDPEVVLERIAEKKKIIKRGNKPDVKRISSIILKDYRDGKLSL